MRLSTLFLMFGIFLGFLSLSVVSTNAATTSDDQVMCPMIYAPVCGTVQVQCIMAPCEPVRQTFGNSCVAGASKATSVTEGACEDTPTSTGVLVGGDRDIHGCIASAGYTWSTVSQSCVRPWEVSTKKSPREALKAHTWNLVSLNGKAITQSGTLTFQRNTFHAKLCNIMNGKYIALKDRIYSRDVISTMMYCDGDIMTVENLLGQRGLTYMVGDTELTIMTLSGDTIKWKK